MLATSSLNAIWTSASPDFGVQGVVDRFGQIEPVVLFTVEVLADAAAAFGAGAGVLCAAKLASESRIVQKAANPEKNRSSLLVGRRLGRVSDRHGVGRDG